MSERLKQVWDWSSSQASESHAFDVNDYYWAKPVESVRFRLVNGQRALLGIQGLQGTGKSTALAVLAETLSEKMTVVKYKWQGDWKKRFFEELCVDDEYWLALWRRLLSIDGLIEEKFKIGHDLIRWDLNDWKEASDKVPDTFDTFVKDSSIDDPMEFMSKIPKSDKVKIRERLDKIADLDKLELILGEKVVHGIKQSFYDAYWRTVDVVFIDMPDYNKTNLQLMNKDIDELQHMWNEFMEDGYKTSFLISVQKEIVMRKPHFFFGKIRWSYLEPLTPDQLLAAYLQKWKTTDPFSEGALRLVGKLSRGVFRRFLGYMNITIETFQMSGKSGLISSEDVERAVSFDVLLRDLELELSDIFSNAQQRIQAVKVLGLLREKTLTQKQIAENLDISEATSGKLVSKLVLYNYVKRTRSKEGSGWIVSLA